MHSFAALCIFVSFKKCINLYKINQHLLQRFHCLHNVMLMCVLLDCVVLYLFFLVLINAHYFHVVSFAYLHIVCLIQSLLCIMHSDFSSIRFLNCMIRSLIVKGLRAIWK